MSATDIVLERDTANDEFASVVTVYVPSGTAVEKDELMFDIENSKATQELRAPTAGILTHDLAVGASVEFGVPIARILQTGDPKEVEGATAARQAEPEIAAAAAPSTAADDMSGQTCPIGPPVDTGVSDARVRTMERLARMDSGDPHRPEPAEATAFSRGSPKRLPESVDPPSGASAAAFVRPGTRPASPRFSIAALTAIAEASLEAGDFSQPFVTLADVRARTDRPHGPRSAASPTMQPSPSPVPLGQAIAGRKQTEIEVLSKGAGNSMLSVLGIGLGALVVPRAPDSLFVDRITDLVIYEASRLMRKFPSLNAAYADGRVVLHEAVNAGLAIDQGGRLVVYGIADADRLGLSDLSDVVADAVGRYVDQSLTAAELSRATFTITDLSASELDFIFPLLPRGQSCILGITRSEHSGFRIFAGFDHRVTEGRDVGLFLDLLRERLLSFGAAPALTADNARCAFCARSAPDAVSRHGGKGLLKIMDQHCREALCCASCWNGW